MKKTVLKINDLNMVSERYGKLEHVSFQVMEGEITGLLGLNYSGKELIAQILLGNEELDWQKNQILVDSRKIRKYADIRNLVYHITVNNSVIKNWTVEEYVGLRDVSPLLTRKVRKQLREETSRQFAQMNVSLDVRKMMGSLVGLELREVEVVKAKKIGARILVVEDECEDMNVEAIREYAQFLKRAAKNRMAVILLCHSNLAASILSDSYVIFRRGRVVKKSKKEFSPDDAQIEKYLLGNTLMRKMRSLENSSRKPDTGENVVYGVRNLNIRDVRENFDFRKGEITTFVISNSVERIRFFLLLSGRTVQEDMSYVIGGRSFCLPQFSVFMENKIVSIMKIGNDYEIFEKMSVGDNLLLPSLKKISCLEYLKSGRKITGILSAEMSDESFGQDIVVRDLNQNSHISIAFDRWYVFNPQVIVLYEPFSSCDAYGVSVITSYINKFSNRGTAVIVVKSNLEYMEDISDRLFDFK